MLDKIQLMKEQPKSRENRIATTDDQVLAVYKARVEQLRQQGVVIRAASEITTADDAEEHWDQLSRVYRNTQRELDIPLVQDALSQLTNEQRQDSKIMLDRVHVALFVNSQIPTLFPVAVVGYQTAGPGAVVLAGSHQPLQAENYLFNYCPQSALDELDHPPPERLFAYNPTREAIVLVQTQDFKTTNFRIQADDELIERYERYGPFSIT